MKCIICIPTHKAELNIFERISLQQCDKVLKGYDKAFVVPTSLALNFGSTYQEYRVERFSDVYFVNSRTYNELCLSEEFYNRFIDYDYMLIYQLDSFVFYDKLEDFCKLGYDYIGAPSIFEGVWEELNINVGNGGFSLRNIRCILNLLNEQRELLNASSMSTLFCSYEDVFYAYCGMREDIDFKTPDVKLAAAFSQQQILLEKKSDISKDYLPFGTHGWDRFNYNVWKPLIEAFGYILPSEKDIHYDSEDEGKKDWNLYRLALEKTHNLNRKLLPFGECSVWGAGTYGKRCIRLLEILGVQIKNVYDWNKNALDYAEDLNYPIFPPTIYNLLGNTEQIIVAVKKPDQEIYSKIALLSKNNYIFFDDLLNKIRNIGEIR